MIYEYLQKWYDEYENFLEKKISIQEGLNNRIDSLEESLKRIEAIENSDEFIFTPNDLIQWDVQRKADILSEKDKVQLQKDQIGKDIEYLGDKLSGLNEMLSYAKQLEEQNSNIEDKCEKELIEKLEFIYQLIDLDPARSKVELKQVIDSYLRNENVSRETF